MCRTLIIKVASSSDTSLTIQGDILNIIGLLTKELVYMFRKFDPITRMIISRDTGLLNEYFTVTKGQLIDLYYFCTF